MHDRGKLNPALSQRLSAPRLGFIGRGGGHGSVRASSTTETHKKNSDPIVSHFRRAYFGK